MFVLADNTAAAAALITGIFIVVAGVVAGGFGLWTKRKEIVAAKESEPTGGVEHSDAATVFANTWKLLEEYKARATAQDIKIEAQAKEIATLRAEKDVQAEQIRTLERKISKLEWELKGPERRSHGANYKGSVERRQT